ncbi:MAG: SsrA-binding protein [Candidatus Tokpelaia sp. JSC085]|nr:MAG: SsrA-binding protein [Candidatus Tokpelaia sp. JSC085]
MNKKKKESAYKLLAENRKVYYHYEILEKLEAGLVLQGSEVKSLRTNHGNIAESYATFESSELWLINCYIPEYVAGNRFNHEPRRQRKLLIGKKDMTRFFNAVTRDGVTIVPVRFYFNVDGRAKLEVALARGKKIHDKREIEKKRDWNREKTRLLRRCH